MLRVEDRDTFVVVSPVRTLGDSASLTDVQLFNLCKWCKENRPTMWKEIARCTTRGVEIILEGC